MKKKTLLFLLLAAVSSLTVTAAAGCSKKPDDSDQNQPCATHVDENKDGKCDVCGETVEVPKAKYDVTFDVQSHGTAPAKQSVEEGGKVTKPSDPTDDDYDFKGWYKEAACTTEFNFDTETVSAATTIYAKWEIKSYEVAFDMQGSGTAIAAVKVDKGGKVEKPADPTDAGNEFQGWYKEAACINAFNFDTETISQATTIYAKWKYEVVTTKLDKTAIEEIGKLEGVTLGSKSTVDVTYGKFFFVTGNQFENNKKDFEESVCVNNQGKDIQVTLGGMTNSISFKAYCSSSSGNSKLTLVKKGADDAVTDVTPTTSGWAVELPKGSKDLVDFEVKDLEAGTYIIRVAQGMKGARIGNLAITEKMERSEATGITVSGATDALLKGREFETTGLNVTLNYANGRKDTLTAGYTVDSSAVKMDTAGKYTVTVNYSIAGMEKPFTATYDVVVYEIESLNLSDHSVDSKRITHPVQQIFKKGETFNHNNLAVTAVCSAPGVNDKKNFILKDAEYTVSDIDVNKLEKQTVTVTAGGKTASYDVNYVDVEGANKLEVHVDAAATAVTQDGTTKIFTVPSINDAIQLFKLMESSDTKQKTITVAAGEYNEKVEIDIPLVKLVGAGENAKQTVIWYNAMNGIQDPSGTSNYSTDGSASVSVRASATGFTAENITFKNYYNTHALYLESKQITNDTQAVALLVQADKAVFKNCFFTSYHDTLYAQKGRHYFENCEIEGRTDYIFGEPATSYFKNCTIRTIGAGDEKNGGYIVATKGEKGLLYGYIFDGCTLTADENVVDGTVSLARGWDTNMTLAFINCDISKAYSKEAYGDDTSVKNDRYTKMNAAPVAAQLFEYNNTGDGALDQSTAGLKTNLCVILTEAQAAEYQDLAKVFAKVQKRTGATDYTSSYADDWDGAVVTDLSTKMYDLTAGSGTDKIEDVFKNEITVEGTYRWNGNSVQFNQGAVIKFAVKGEISIEWYGQGYGDSTDGSITYKDGFATLTIVGTDNNNYIISISLNTENVPADTAA